MASEAKRKILTSPGMILWEGGAIFEQVSSKGGSAYAVRTKREASPYIVSRFEVGEVTYYPMEKCPWKLPSQPSDYGDESKLYGEVRDFIHEHLDISKDDRYYDAMAAWIMADWIQENFNTASYLHFHGPPNSGKSRGLEVIQALGYRVLLSPSVSPAALYRTIEVFRPTFLIDEAELYTSKGLDESKREVLSVLNAGYRRGQVVIRADAQGETLRLFDVFGFKALASVQGLPDTLAGRAIRIPMMRAARKVKRTIDEERALELRNKLLAYRFNRVLEKPKEANPLDISDGRLIEIFSPLVSVAPNERVESTLTGLVKDVFSEIVEEERTSDEAQVFFCVLECMTKGVGFLAVSDVADRYNADKPKKDQVTNSYCGRVLKTLGFQKKRMPGTGRTAIILDKSLIERLKIRYGVAEQKKLGEDASWAARAKEWLVANRDGEGLVSLSALAEFIRGELNLDPQKTIERLFEEALIARAPSPGKAVVV